MRLLASDPWRWTDLGLRPGIGDYVAVNVPFGMMLGRIANFINGELWGKPSGLHMVSG